MDSKNIFFRKLLLLFYIGFFSPIFAQNYIVLVDPVGFQAGDDFPAKAIELGYTPILVFSDFDHYQNSLANKNLRLHKLYLDKNLETTTGKISEITQNGKLLAALPGKESGTIIAESLATILHLPTNDTSKPMARQHKVALQEALKAAGLNHLPSIEIKQGEDIDSAVASFLSDQSYSSDQLFISKPCQSSCSDTIFITKAKDIRGVTHKILNKKNTLNKKINSSAAIQLMAQGTEYIIDIVSFNLGSHIETVPIGVWRYYRESSTDKSRSGLIRHVDWIPLNEAPSNVVEYAQKASLAAGVKQGISHVEVFDGPQGVVTHDLAARLPGGLPKITQQVTDGKIDILKLAIESVVNPEASLHELKKNLRALNEISGKDKKFARIVFLNRRGQENYLEPHVHDSVKSIKAPTLVGYRTFVEPGSWQPPSVDVLTGVLRLHLVGSQEAVIADEKKFRTAHTKQHLFLTKRCSIRLRQ